MKIVVAGAFGNLGTDILKMLKNTDNEIIALDQEIKKLEEIDLSKIKCHEINMDKKETYIGKFKGVDVVISTIGLVGRASLKTPYEVDYLANHNLLNDALASGVKKFIYVSHIGTPNDNVPVLKAKSIFEKELVDSGIDYLIIKPTTFYSTIKKEFDEMNKSKKAFVVSYKDYRINPISSNDVAKFIVEHLDDKNAVYTIGGKEIYSYLELASIFVSKTLKIKRMSKLNYKLIGYKNRKIKNGITIENKFRLWRYTNNLISDIKYGEEKIVS